MALTDKLTAIGDAIREKTGETDLIPLADMPDKIKGIEGGGSLEPLELTGDCSYTLSGQTIQLLNMPELINAGKVSIKNPTSLSYLFYNGFNNDGAVDISKIPIQLAGTGTNPYMDHAFAQTNIRGKLPDIINVRPSASTSFGYCFYASRYTDFEDLPRITYAGLDAPPMYAVTCSCLFQYCYGLRKMTAEWWHKNIYGSSTTYSCFSRCYAMEDLEFPIYPTLTISSNAFANGFIDTYHLKHMRFETEADGSPIVVKWKNQTIILSSAGWGRISTLARPDVDVSSLEVRNATTYNNLKDGYYWTTYEQYAHYDVDSAKETILTLPDTSAYLATAGGTNTIQFRGSSGSNKECGSIKDNLGDEYIAIATEKGWTVTII